MEVVLVYCFFFGFIKVVLYCDILVIKFSNIILGSFFFDNIVISDCICSVEVFVKYKFFEVIFKVCFYGLCDVIINILGIGCGIY